MADTTERFTGLALSAIDVRQLTGWPDPMIEDYLSLLETLIELANTIDLNNGLTRQVQKQIVDPLFLPEFYVPDIVAITANYTTIGNQTIIGNNTNSVIISLNATPSEFETLNIKMANKQIVINGNGKTIDGNNSVTLTQQYTNLQLIYNTVSDSWLIL